ncbi:MAG: 4-(cytidine 5'-diphospho)-2-C-methyl-D-erythritol kinase [Spirochaetes bacterium]|nr:4-(cytidine 5'-diphospho)-2-C-methyl-D-erythritol kinase [Spirochaetota bacterium]
MKIEARAYSKINLHLEILNKREDGYHNLFSFNTSAGIFDVLTFNKIDLSNKEGNETIIDIIPAGGRYSKLAESIPAEANLVTKAVRAYLKKIGASGRISISLKKDIPAGAGLAGGSTDAAAALRTLNDHAKALSEDELAVLAAGIGADVPYCLKGGFAICEGIGERIEQLNGKTGLHVFIANCGIHVNTGWAYTALNRKSDLPGNINENIKKTRNLIKDNINKECLEAVFPYFKNDFEDIIFNKYPEIKYLKEEIIDHGAEFAIMTGSGSSVVGLYKDIEKAEKTLENLSNKATVFLTRFTF